MYSCEKLMFKYIKQEEICYHKPLPNAISEKSKN